MPETRAGSASNKYVWWSKARVDTSAKITSESPKGNSTQENKYGYPPNFSNYEKHSKGTEELPEERLPDCEKIRTTN
jgi:hypothetical protein